MTGLLSRWFRSYAFWTALLMLAGVLRVFQVAWHTPMIGYANQADMGRMHNCFGIWPDRQDINVFAGYAKAPINRYKMGGPADPEDCYQSSEKLFVQLGILAGKLKNYWFDRPQQQLELQTIGLVKAAILCLTGCWLSWLYRRRPPAALAHAAIFAMVIADPYNTLWLNTLYTEFAALYFVYLSAALAHYLLTTGKPGLLIKLAFLASLFLLGTAKMQHLLLPTLLGGMVLLARLRMFRQEQLFSVGIVVVCLAVLLVQQQVDNRHMRFVKAANAADTYFGAVLPAMHEPVQGVRLLGLPDKCAHFVGYTWYQQHGIDLGKECPEVFSVPRWRLLRVIAHDPKLVLNMLKRALPETKEWNIGYLGQIEGADFAGIDSLSWRFFSFATWVQSLPLKVFMWLYILFGLAWLYAAVKFLRFLFQRRGEVPWLVLISSSVVWMVIFASIFGDGYSEVAKHAHLSYGFFQVLTFALVVGWPMSIFQKNPIA
ncbi:MAG: hypothetical protein WB870_02955 [Gallionellaceae bacterium]